MTPKDDLAKLDEILKVFYERALLSVGQSFAGDPYEFTSRSAKAQIAQLITEARINELKHLEGGTDYWLDNGEVTTVADRIAELKGNHDV